MSKFDKYSDDVYKAKFFENCEYVCKWERDKNKVTIIDVTKPKNLETCECNEKFYGDDCSKELI